MSIEVGALDGLLDSGLVASLQIDDLAAPTLRESIPIVGSDVLDLVDIDGRSTTIAILDTGVEKAHPFMGGGVIYEKCFADDSLGAPGGDCPNGSNFQDTPGAGEPCTWDGCAHGTHVAGIAAGLNGDPGDGGSLLQGVANGALYAAYQIFHKEFTTCEAWETVPCSRRWNTDYTAALEDMFFNRGFFDANGTPLDDRVGAPGAIRRPRIWLDPCLSTSPECFDVPGNNWFGSAYDLATVSCDVSSACYSYLAIKQADEPDHAGNSGGNSVWFKWKAPSDGTMTVTTAGSSFDTLLGVYTGSSPAALVEVASNDDDPNGGVLTSAVIDVPVDKGVWYRIAVDGYSPVVTPAGPAGRVLIDLAFTPAPFLCNGFAATKVGTAAGETINGTSGRDVIVAGAGNDMIFGFGGNDVICAQDGDDYVEGGGGLDFIAGGNGNDVMFGGPADDSIYGGFDDDSLYGGDGDDYIHAGPGVDFASGGSGVDAIYGKGQADTIDGGNGSDFVSGDGGNDLVIGGGGPDEMYGGYGNDILAGWSGDDVMFGGPANNFLNGGTGSNTCDGGTGTNTLVNC